MKDRLKVLALNPGSTSTKVGVFIQEVAAIMDQLSPVTCKWTCSLVHSDRELERFRGLPALAQSEFRAAAIKEALEAGGYRGDTFAAVAGRGGLLPPHGMRHLDSERADD